MTAEAQLCQAIESFLATTPDTDPWQRCWKSAQYLFSLHPYLHEERSDLLFLQTQLHTRIDSARPQLEQMLPHVWLAHIQEAVNDLKHDYEHVVGDLTRSPGEGLDALHELQRQLDALQWLTSDLREEGAFAIAEAFADLAMIEREIHHTKHEFHQATSRKHTAPSNLPALRSTLQDVNAKVLNLRNDLLGRESQHYIQRTLSLLPHIQLADSLQSHTTQNLSRRTGSIPRRISTTSNKPKEPETETQGPAPSMAELDACWDALLQGEALVLAISLELPKHEGETQLTYTLLKLLEDLERHRQQLKQQINTHLEHTSPEEQRHWFAVHLQGVIDEVDESLATLDDIPLDEAIIHLKHLETQLVWLQAQVQPLEEKGKEGNQAFRNAYKQFKRLRGRLRAEAHERKLQARLEARFGKRLVELSENVILFLILLVVVFLSIEFSFQLKPLTRTILMWVDTAICFVFLAEFFTKLSFAEEKGLYFRRHFLIDLLPSIPFSLVFSLVQGATVASSVAAGRAARLARISRLARYIRILRPLIRIFRVLVFLMRACDRLVRRYETVFNRNVVLFPSPTEKQRALQRGPQAEMQALRERCRKRMRMLLHQMPHDERLGFLQERTSQVVNILESHDGESRNQGLLQQTNEIVYLDELVDKMITVDEIEVEELLGEQFIVQTNRIFRFLDAPVIRSLPVIHKLAKAHRELDPAALVAWMIRGFGKMLERVQRTIQWIGDLYGIVTGPQVLDRIGLTLINATLRPARRLLLFGFLFLVVTLFIQAFSIGWFNNAAKFLAKFLGAPIIILGLFSLIPLALGFWFRMIAGETTDFFARISEAQFISRLKLIKNHKTQSDLNHLVQRVLIPESFVRQEDPPPPEQLVSELQTQLGQHGEFSLQTVSKRGTHVSLPSIQPFATQPDIPTFAAQGPTGSQAPPTQQPKENQSSWSERDRVLLLYEDYLDGTPLHKSDTKTTNHLLGNLTIQNIRKHRLGLSLVQNLRIEKLDLSRPRLLLYFGPYLWFSSITESLTHRIARLIVEYNQNCIPRDELSWYEDNEREQYEEWISRRENRLNGIPQPTERQKKDEQAFRTTAFTAVHFISAEPERDRDIAMTFGTRVERLMRAERKLLVQELFGYYPFHNLSKDSKTFNLYQSYQNHIAGGRFFFLPFKMIWWLLRSLYWGVLQVQQIVKDVLQPPTQVETEVKGKAGFDVAIRKINRMRKPLYIECMRLRSEVDIEYLGFFLPGRTSSGLQGNTYTADLEFIGASRAERREFETRREEREKQIHLFESFLDEQQWKGDALIDTLHQISPSLAEKHGEVLRAMTSAFSADYNRVRSLLAAERELVAFLSPAYKEEHPAKPTVGQWLSLGAKQMLRTTFFIRADKERETFLQCLALFGENTQDEDRISTLWNMYKANRKRLQPHIKLVASTKERPKERVIAILEEVMRHSSIWTEELLTLRTLQTLTQLDIQLYRELVHTMGGYDEKHPLA